jgi:hypothetical protein
MTLIEQLLSGATVQPRQAPAQIDGLGNMLAFLQSGMNGTQGAQPIPLQEHGGSVGGAGLGTIMQLFDAYQGKKNDPAKLQSDYMKSLKDTRFEGPTGKEVPLSTVERAKQLQLSPTMEGINTGNNILQDFLKQKSEAEFRAQTGDKSRGPIPTGFRINDNGELIDMPISGGGTYRDYMLSMANQKAQIPSYGEDIRLKLSEDSNNLQRQKFAEDIRARQDQQIRQDKKDAQSQLQNVPAVHRMSYIENKTALDQIDNAINLIKENPGHLGLKNLLGDNVSQRVDPKGVDVRAKVAEIGGVKLHDLSGAAVQANEAKRLMPLIPTVTDSDEAALKKLKGLKSQYLDINNQIKDMYSNQSEYKNPIPSNENKIPDNANFAGMVKPEAEKTIAGKKYFKINGEWHVKSD